MNNKSYHIVLIENATLSDCWGDGVYLGTDSKFSKNDNRNIVINNVICNNNRRQRMSIVNR